MLTWTIAERDQSPMAVSSANRVDDSGARPDDKLTCYPGLMILKRVKGKWNAPDDNTVHEATPCSQHGVNKRPKEQISTSGIFPQVRYS